MNISKLKITLMACICLALLSSSCAENQYAGRTIGTVGGAVLGGVIGGLTGGTRGAIIGAISGAAVGFGVGWIADNYKANQLKSAEDARKEAIQESGLLPDEPKLNNYDVSLRPPDIIRRGETGKIVSTIDLYPGNKGKVDVKEVAVLTLPDRTEKSATISYPEISEGGTYEFEREINTKGIPGGVYGYKTTLYMNGNAVANSQSSFKVVSNETFRYAFMVTEVWSVH
jgi:uncharacterized protein YcfJ